MHADTPPETPRPIPTLPYRVPPGTRVGLTGIDPAEGGGLDKAAGKTIHDALNRRLEQLQELLYADGRDRLLIVLQAMDTGGKDGVIKDVFDGVNPQGVRVASFKRPTPADLAHDYLWRVHPHVPGNGEMVLFNRSHYEDVLVVRVHDLVPPARWERRYEQIAAFERMLAEEGTTIRKFFLHISREEQGRRLKSRLDDPTKRWKFAKGDLAERARWDDYLAAYQEAISRTSTEWAPWYVVPADRKWFRNLVVASVLVETLEGLGLSYPEPEDDLTGVVID